MWIGGNEPGDVSEGGGVPRAGPADAAHVLRCPRRALEPRADDQSRRVPVSHGAVAAAGDQGAGSRTQGWVRADTLWVMAEARWRKRNAPPLLPLVQAQVKCVEGMQQRRNEEKGVEEAA